MTEPTSNNAPEERVPRFKAGDGVYVNLNASKDPTQDKWMFTYITHVFNEARFSDVIYATNNGTHHEKNLRSIQEGRPDEQSQVPKG